MGNFNHMKKWIKVVLVSFMGLLLLAGIAFGYLYYKYEGRYKVNKEKYTNYIGHLPYATETSKFELCDENRIVGWFASAATYFPIYKGSKSTFKEYILQNFETVNQNDNGFLNLRFIINCKGEVGRMEINELDTDYQSTLLSPNLVNQIVTLSSRKENWTSPIIEDVTLDSYMYLIYKIENGKITEILP